MKVITATMANNIANDFFNNECGDFIKLVMDNILRTALKGEHGFTANFPCGWTREKRHNIELFFQGLGYKVTHGDCSMSLKW